MVKEVDVVVENFRADVKYRLNVDYETLSKINPRLVYASISVSVKMVPIVIDLG